MGNTATSEKENIVSPKGTFLLAIVSTPSTKFKPEGEFTAKIAVPLDQAGPLLTKIKAAAKASLDQAKKENPKKAAKMKAGPLPFEIDEDTGTVVLKTKRLASGTSKKTGKKWTATIPIFDAKGKPVTGEVRIGDGSEGRVSFSIRPYYTDLVGAGVTLSLEGLQLTKYVEWTGSASADKLGFTADEDGFSTDDLAPKSEFDDDEDETAEGEAGEGAAADGDF